MITQSENSNSKNINTENINQKFKRNQKETKSNSIKGSMQINTTKKNRDSLEGNNSQSKMNNSSEIWEEEKNNESIIEEVNYEYVFKVIKLGRLGFSHKERILHLFPNGIEYYVIPDYNETTKEFLDTLTKIYESKSLEDKSFDKFQNLAELFNKLPEKEKKIKNKFENYLFEINNNKNNNDSSTIEGSSFIVYNADKDDRTNADNFWNLDACEDLIRNHIFHARDKLLENKKKEKEKNDDTSNSQIKLNKTLNNKLNSSKDDRQKEKLSNDKMIILNDYKDKIKYINIIYQGFMKEYLYEISEFHKKKREYEAKIGYKQSNNNNIEFSQFFQTVNDNKMPNKNIRIRKYTEMNLRNDMSMNAGDRDKDKENNDPMKEQINDTLKIAYLELAIYHIYDMFIKYCEKVVEKIVNHLYTFDKADDILKPDKLHPIVFPNPTNFTQIINDNDDKIDESSEPVLLYSIWGVNYTLTWHRLTYKFGDTVGTSGNWKKVKLQFRQKNYFQDLLIKLASISYNTDNFPNIPMSCVIDYNGFRVYCEADIYAGEEYLEGMRLQINKKDMEFMNNLMSLISETNNDENKKIEDTDIYCKIKSEYIAEEKGFQLNNYIKTMIEEFLKSFNNAPTQGSIVNDIKKVDPFIEMQSQRPIINAISRLITEDRTVMGDDKKQFEDYQNESIEFQKNCTFQYLMYFDVLIPLDLKIKKHEAVYYRQELAINNINLKEEIKRAHPNFFRNEDDDYDFEDYSIHNKEEQSIDSKNSSEINNSNVQSIRSKKINNKNPQKISSDDFPKKYKTPEEIILDIIKQNTYQNNEQIRIDLKKNLDIKLSNLITALDSLYLIPYNSETLKLCFHHYGINLHFLGKVAERTTVPHIREICVIEMFARVCKKIIFDLLGQNTYERAMKAFYSNIKELTTKLHCIPVSLNVLYGSNYLKSITQPVERGKCYYKNMEITGLYMNNEEYPLNEFKFDKEKKANNETEYSSVKYQKVNNFLILLFGGFMNKTDLVINGVEIRKSEELWNLIKNIMRKQYEITNEDVFMYCELETMSVYSLVGAIQYHTGLQFQNEIGSLLEKVMTQKLENLVLENLSPLPKKSYYSFTYFLCKENIILPLTNNFAMYFPERTKYNQAKLNYYAEKFLYKKKIAHNYFYLSYLKILKEWDFENSPKTGKIESKNDEFERSLSNVNDYSPVQISTSFEDHFESFLALITSQYQPKTQKKITRNDNQDIQNKIDINLIFTCTKIISNYWKNDHHPFISILKSTYAKALFKNTRSRRDQTKIEDNFNEAVKIARDSMGELNLFYGKLTRDVGMFYEKNFKFKEAFEMFYLSYKVFKKYKKVFKREYFYALKNLTKTCVFLGRLQECLKYGIILVEEITKESNKTLIDPLKVQDYTSLFGEQKKIKSWEQIHNMNAFTFNLMKVAKYLKEYDICVKIGNIFFSTIKNYKNFKITQFKNWLETSKNRAEKLMISKNNQNKGEIKLNREHRIDEQPGKDKKIDSVIRCYLKCLFRGLKGSQNKAYARAYLSFLENCYNEEYSQMNQEKIDELFYEMFFRAGIETFDQHLKKKILFFLLQKYMRENLNKDDVEHSYNLARKDLELIYYKFKKKSKKIFVLPEM